MKSLLPTLKEKKRYIVFEIVNIEKKTQTNMLTKISQKIQQILGLFDSAEAGLMVVELKKNKGIIRVNNKYVDKTIAAMLFIKEIDDVPVIIKPITTTGLLQKAKQA
ncbi:hypothetical protein K9K83_06525 [Candidatus Woesearchaeota archaeon]|nr:hypothetical protein [Candidatus Woesearchaeota archaeon]